MLIRNKLAGLALFIIGLASGLVGFGILALLFVSLVKAGQVYAWQEIPVAFLVAAVFFFTTYLTGKLGKKWWVAKVNHF